KESKKKESTKKETTQVSARAARFGDSLLDEVILLLIILVSIVVFVSLLIDKMGIIGGLISDFFKGLFGFSSILLPVFVILYCIWMLVSKERRFPVVRAFGIVLLLLTVASAAQIIHPVQTGDAGFFKRCALLYGAGAFSNGGLFGGLIGGGLHAALATLGSTLVLLVVLIISIVMATGKSFFHAIGSAHAHQKARRKVKNEKIKNKAERIRQQELIEEERLQKIEARRKKTMAKEDFNIELHESGKKEAEPYVKETVFRKTDLKLETKKKEPIFDFVKEGRTEAEAKKNLMKAEAAAMAAAALQQAETKNTVDLSAPFIDITAVEDDPVQTAEAELAVEAEPVAEVLTEETEEELEEQTEEAAEAAAEGEEEEYDIPILEIVSVADEMEEMATSAPVVERTVEEAEAEIAVEAEEESPAEAESPKTEAAAQEGIEAEIPTEPVEEEKPYIFPPIELLGEDPQTGGGGNRAEMIENAKKLETTLKSFGVEAKVIQISKGPTVTRYELSPSQGVKVSKIVNLADDIALNLA
ncbi:MAG: DNA translocase FtsK 4TM domain-containing protein, partial [Bacillota bacterium]|nr:DNA translocase FtsK 4TM domain-containing protein [Bacillota bacterium]